MTLRFLMTLLVGTAGGLVGMKTKIPAGALFGAMVATAIYNILSNKGYIPPEPTRSSRSSSGPASASTSAWTPCGAWGPSFCRPCSW